MRIKEWNGKRSIKIIAGRLTIGCSWGVHPAAFCIWSGKRISWQLQTFGVRFAYWKVKEGNEN